MDDRRLDLGLVHALRAESFGEPGERTFRLLLTSASGNISLWLEKEQIVMLGSAIQDLLAQLSEAAGMEPASATASGFTGELEVKAESLALGYDADRQAFSIEASDFTSSPFEIGTIVCLASREQLVSVGEEIKEIVAGSRPRCVLCGTPLDNGRHFCPESNGHAETRVGE